MKNVTEQIIRLRAGNSIIKLASKHHLLVGKMKQDAEMTIKSIQSKELGIQQSKRRRVYIELDRRFCLVLANYAQLNNIKQYPTALSYNVKFN